ncbi:MAG: hypothetical protein WEA77_12855 [Hyphomonas sp.]|uniref:macro domain-containing protein n=1 Tax=Hyphomonas sp. TaxID=87 RepID=UPI0034A02FC5
MDGGFNGENADSEQESSVVNTGRRCFVIMPFGVRTEPISGRTYDFDAVYNRLIEPVVRGLGIECIRSDKVSQAGMIHKEMIEYIVNSELAIVDITMGNPNVMYELGVRHTARRSGTVIIRDAGSNIPFNIAGMRAVDYTVPSGESPEEDDILAESQSLLESIISNSLDRRTQDSLVHTVVPGLNVALPAKVIATRARHLYPAAADKQFEIITGDIGNIDDVDAWVNPENTRMELARMHDASVSALIRYRGSYRDKRGHVTRDAVYGELRRVLGGRTWAGVEPGTVVTTPPGALRRSNGVKLLIHVAAHHGEPGKGYQLIKSFTNCVTNSLEAIDEYNSKFTTKMQSSSMIRSVLFPLFGNRGRSGSQQEVTSEIVETAHEYLLSWPDTKIARIGFLAYTDSDLEQVEIALKRTGLCRSKVCRNGKD